MNVALYGAPHRWAMTERGRKSLRRSADHIAIGPSALAWDGEKLTVTIAETTVPLPSRLRGTVVLRPRGLAAERFDLDAAGAHRWQPIAPLSDVEVRLESPALAWRGTGYFDTNAGDEPLEAGFRSWTWSRFDMGRSARIFYDVFPRDDAPRGLSLAVDADGVRHAEKVAYQPIARTGWRIPRQVPCESPAAPCLLRTMENAPFYARSAVRCRIDGILADGVHESLDLGRVAAPLVRLMLPFKMPRRA